MRVLPFPPGPASMPAWIVLAFAPLACVGAAALMFAIESPAIGAALAVALAVACWPFATRQPMRALLFVLFAAAPVDIVKALISPDDMRFRSDAPGLSLSAMDLVLLTWGVSWLLRRRLVERRPIRWSRIDVAAGAFLAWMWIGALRSPAGGLAMATALAYSKYVIAFWLMSWAMRGRGDWRVMLAAGSTMLIAQSLHVFAQAATRSPLALPGIKLPDHETVLSLSGGSAFRPVGFFNHPNALADYLALVLPVALCLVMLGPTRLRARTRLLAAAVLGMGALALALTLTRGGWISFGIGGVFGVAAFWRAGLIRGRQIARGLAALAVMLALVPVAMPSIVDRIFGPDSRSLESRSLLASQAMDMLRDHPLTGIGYGGYNRVSMAYTPPGFAFVSPDYQKMLRELVVHNYYLLLAVELGVPALVLFLSIFVCLIAAAWRQRGWLDPGRFAVCIGLAGGVAGNLFFLASDNYYADVRMAMLWLVAGLLQAMLLTERHAQARARAGGRGDAR